MQIYKNLSNNNNINYYDPEKDASLIKSKIIDFETLYRDKETHKPIFSEEYSDFNEDSKLLIVKDLIHNNYIATKTFTKYFQKSQRTQNLENAKLFLSDTTINIYNSKFFFRTIELLKKNKHPLQIEHIPGLFFNKMTKEIYTGINYFNISYKNIINKNNCNTFYSASLIEQHNLLFIKKGYTTVVRKCTKDKEIYDIIVPTNFIKNDKQEIFNKPIKLEDTFNIPIKEDDLQNVKIIKTLNTFFYCVFNNLLYKPNDYILSGDFINYIKENPSLFLELLDVINTNIKQSIIKED